MSLPHVSVIGAGHVGATTAHLVALKGLANVTLCDVVEGLAQGTALDLFQSASVEGFAGTVEGTTTYDRLAGSRVVVITAGMARKPGMSRDELLVANANIVGPIAERVAQVAPEARIIVVTNPLDVMVGLALRRSGFPRSRVMGMAGILDTARLRAFVAQQLDVVPSEVEALVLGSHGDLMVPIKSALLVGGKPVSDRLDAEAIEELCQRTKDGGAEIVKLLKQGSAYFAPASGVVQMVEAILKDTQTVLPVCAWLEGEYGVRDVCIGVPVVLGASGIERVVEMPLTQEESRALRAAAEKVREMIKGLPAVQVGR